MQRLRKSGKPKELTLEEMDSIASKSKLTEKDVEELAAKMDAGILKRWRKLADQAKRTSS